jgi:hypothetical protein
MEDQLEHLFIDLDFLVQPSLINIQHKTFGKMRNLKILYLNLNKKGHRYIEIFFF